MPKVQVQSIDKWYIKFLRDMKKIHGKNWISTMSLSKEEEDLLLEPIKLLLKRLLYGGNMQKMLKDPVKITLCRDGHVSIMREGKDRRLNSALPFHSSPTVEKALELISKVCIFKACSHGGRTGTTVEAWFPA